MFSMKWQGGDRPARTNVSVESLPACVQGAGERLLAHLTEDAAWIAGPVNYLAQAPRGFCPDNFAELALKQGDGPPSFSRVGWVAGLKELGERYPEIPSVLWDTIAIMGLRPSPHVEEEIPQLGSLLLHDWGISDACLHAAAKATALWGDICNTLVRHSGCYVEHGCGCSHIVRELQQGATFPAMPADRHEHVTREFWEHCLSEVALIYVLGFPFALNANHAQYAGTLKEPVLAL
jgi:hypothetical protein